MPAARLKFGSCNGHVQREESRAFVGELGGQLPQDSLHTDKRLWICRKAGQGALVYKEQRIDGQVK